MTSPTISISLESMFSDEYLIIALHSPIEAYRIAFFLNQGLKIKLSYIQDENLETANVSSFKRWSYDDKNHEIKWHLVENKWTIEDPSETQNNLFGNSVMKTEYLLPEFPKVDYFIVVEGEDIEKETESVLSIIKKIPIVSAYYELPFSQIKNKQNLIFN